MPSDEVTVLWRVTPDYGENDHHVLPREEDIENGKKKSGWTNPLGWHDNGHGDDKVVLQLASDLKWRVTPDYGELDPTVVSRERDIDNGKKFSGWTNPLGWSDDGADDEKVLIQVGDDDSSDEDELAAVGVHESFYNTPADNGVGDEDVMIQTKQAQQGRVWIHYDESEGPTKADNGDSDFSVVYRESDIKNGEKFSGWTNPLSWTDNGDADDTVV